ncbi:MAG: signal protein [Myxococcaceae bacterium]
MDATRPKPGFGRRTYVIDRGFQLKYTLLLVAAGAVVSLLFGSMMYLAHAAAARDAQVPPEVRAQLAAADTTLLILMVAVALLMAVALGLFGVLVTHRVAGPVYVMSHYVSVLAKGRYPIMRPLRRSDELRAFFERFQTAVESMRVREAQEAEALERAVAHLGGAAANNGAHAALEELRQLAARKRDATDRVDVGASSPS